MFLVGKAVKYFLDELNGNLGNYTDGHKSMFSSNVDYLKIKELYNACENKSDAVFIIQEALNEFDRSRSNITKDDWQMTNDHYVELCETFPGDFAFSVSNMFYQELYERDERIVQMSEEQNTSREDVLKRLLEKGV